MAGSGGFSIVISATDAASAKIDAINKRLAAINAPVQRVQKSLAKFADLSGINKLRDGLSGLAGASLNAFRNLMRIVEPLAAITGALSLAGMMRMVSVWAEWGSTLGFAAQRIGITAERLDALEGAARLAGSAAGSMSSGMKSLKDSLTNAANGTAPEAVMAFNRLHVSIRNAATGAVRTADEVLPELVDALKAEENATIQARLATMLFGAAAEDLLPVLRGGSKALAENEAEARKHGLVNEAALAAMSNLARAQRGLTLAYEGFQKSLSEHLDPTIQQIVTDMTNLLDANREWIASDIGKVARSIAGDMKYFAGQLGDAKSAALTLGAYFAGPWVGLMMLGLGPVTAAIAAIVSGMAAIHAGNNLSPESLPADSPLWRDIPEKEQLNYRNSPASRRSMGAGNPNPFHWWNPGSWLGRDGGGPGSAPANGTAPNGIPPVGPRFGPQNMAGARDAYNAFIAQGWTPQQAVGLVANMQRESGGRANAVGDGGQAYGLFQWHPDRQAAFAQFAGHDIHQSTAAEQIAFANYELRQGREQAAGMRLAGASTPEAAAAAVSTYYERPADKAGEAAIRAAYAQQMSGLLIASPRAMNVGPAQPMNIANGTGASVSAPPPIVLPPAEVKGTVNVTVSQNGMPPGTKVAAVADGNVFGGAPRIAQAMPLL